MNDNTNKTKSSGNRSNKNYRNNRNNKSNSANANAKRNSSRNRRPKSLTPVRVIQKYDNLLEQYMVARKKIYEVYARVSGKQLQKVQSNYKRTLKALNDYEGTLKDWQKEVLNKKINAYPQDRQFSTAHELGTEGDLVEFKGDFEDPHLLSTQVEAKASYASDTEETSGTIDEYKSYKGISE